MTRVRVGLVSEQCSLSYGGGRGKKRIAMMADPGVRYEKLIGLSTSLDKADNNIYQIAL